MDAVAIGSIAAVVLTIIVIGFIAVRIKHLMNTSHSED